MKKLIYENENPRLGTLLHHGGASARLRYMLYRFRKWGLKRFEKEWPEARRRAELFGWGTGRSGEFQRVLNRRPLKLFYCRELKP